MRKALMGFILAATVMTPIAAEAQRFRADGERGSHSRGDGGNRGDRGGNRGGGEGRVRNDAPQQQEQQQPAPQPRAERQVARGEGGNRGGNWNRGGNDGNRGGNDGNRGDWNRGNRGGDGDGERRGRRNDQPSVYPQAWQGNPNDPRLERYRQLEQRNQNRGYDRDGRGDRDGRDGRWRGDRSDRNDRNWRGDRNGRNDWNRGWRNDNRYNWSYWRSQNRNRYRLSPYYSPYRNWSYRRFSIGLFLDSLFYNQRYWIGDPYQYRLPPAPYGTQWVRYYNDVLLVDIYTGEVVDAIYDFFW